MLLSSLLDRRTGHEESDSRNCCESSCSFFCVRCFVATYARRLVRNIGFLYACHCHRHRSLATDTRVTKCHSPDCAATSSARRSRHGKERTRALSAARAHECKGTLRHTVYVCARPEVCMHVCAVCMLCVYALCVCAVCMRCVYALCAYNRCCGGVAG
jgi:hypothetical protein